MPRQGCQTGDTDKVVRDFIGINIEGWVRNEEFENRWERARLIRNEMAQGALRQKGREGGI